jgi:hypothetical protein
MNVFTNYLEKLGSNFLVASMVPSLAFVVTTILVFDPILGVAFTFKDPEGTFQLAGFSLLIFILTVLIGFTLTALNTYILKLFEGYIVVPPLRFLYNYNKRKHVYRANKLAEDIEILKREIRKIERQSQQDSRLEVELEVLRDKYYTIASQYEQNYPENPIDIMPTRFGNTLKAAENYSGDRYGFDGVQFFPRLVHVIPQDYKVMIDTTRNELSFLVNMSILSFVFTAQCAFAVAYVMWSFPLTSTGSAMFLEFILKSMPYSLAAIFGFVSSYFFYNASIFSVTSFGLLIRASMDLFRLDLLKKMNLESPADSIEEFNTWTELNELIVLGHHSLTFRKLEYRKGN